MDLLMSKYFPDANFSESEGYEDFSWDAIWDAEWHQNLMDAAIQRVKRQVKPKHFQVFELYALKQWPVPKVAKTLPAASLPAELKGLLVRLEAKLPPIPVREIDGVPMLAPAERFADKRNVENPELYAVYPFRLYGLDKPLGEQYLLYLRRQPLLRGCRLLPFPGALQLLARLFQLLQGPRPVPLEESRQRAIG
jgi:hypothetical protein